MIRQLMTLLVVFSVNTLLAQWKETTLEDFSKAIMASESKIAQNSSYSFDASYLFFEQLDSKEQVLKFNGRVACDNGKHLYMDQFDRWTVQDQQVNVTCDTAQRIVIVKEFDSLLINRKTMDSYALFLKSKCTVKKQPAGKGTQYYVSFAPGAQYKAAEILFNEKGLVEKYVLYAGMEIQDDSKPGAEKMIEPRLEIYYSNYLFGTAAATKSMRRVTDFVTPENGKYTLKPAYAGFELIDLRTPTN